MTTFSYPLRVRGRDTNVPSYRTVGRVATYYEGIVSAGQIGSAVAGTTIVPLRATDGTGVLVLPAGSRIVNAFIDILTPIAPVSGTNMNIGYGTARNQVFTATSIETAGARSYAPTTAQISANRANFAIDTTIEALVCVSGTASITAGEFLVLLEVI